jgi:hypothetical protein
MIKQLRMAFQTGADLPYRGSSRLSCVAGPVAQSEDPYFASAPC